MKIKTFKHVMPVEGAYEDSSLEITVNNFIKDKIVIDIKYTSFYIEARAEFCHTVLIMYEEDNKDNHHQAIMASVDYDSYAKGGKYEREYTSVY